MFSISNQYLHMDLSRRCFAFSNYSLRVYSLAPYLLLFILNINYYINLSAH